jgi:hypothetical protein
MNSAPPHTHHNVTRQPGVYVRRAPASGCGNHGGSRRLRALVLDKHLIVLPAGGHKHLIVHIVSIKTYRIAIILNLLTADTVFAHAADVKHAENATAPPFTQTCTSVSTLSAAAAWHQEPSFTCALLLASDVNAQVTNPLTVLLTKPAYLHESTRAHCGCRPVCAPGTKQP